MQIIYLDVLAVLNFCMDYCVLRASAGISGRECSAIRLAAASGVGAAYASICVLVPFCGAVPFRLICVGVMSAMTFGFRQRAVWVRNTLTVLLVSFVFGGGVCAVSAMCGTNFYRGGVLYAPVSRTVLIVAAGISYFISAVVFRRKAAADAPRSERVTICAGGRTGTVHLLCDSGNLLTDPLTGRPALILTMQSAQILFPEAVRTAQPERIPFESLGGDGAMPGFVPEEIRREDGSRYQAVVALTTQTIGAEYDGLIATGKEDSCGTFGKHCAESCADGSHTTAFFRRTEAFSTLGEQ